MPNPCHQCLKTEFSVTVAARMWLTCFPTRRQGRAQPVVGSSKALPSPSLAADCAGPSTPGRRCSRWKPDRKRSRPGSSAAVTVHQWRTGPVKEQFPGSAVDKVKSGRCKEGLRTVTDPCLKEGLQQEQGKCSLPLAVRKLQVNDKV